MNYIYDIVTNFNDEYYDFYEWNKNDNISHIKKIPIIKISKEDFINLNCYQFSIEQNYIFKIKNKTEFYGKKEKKDNYYLLITNGNDIIGIQFNEQGYSIKRSSLIVEEELDIIAEIKKISLQKIDFNLQNKIKIYNTTRYERNRKSYLMQELNKLAKNNKQKIIDYIYFECFNEQELNTKNALNKIYNNINNKNIFNFLYDFFKTIKQ